MPSCTVKSTDPTVVHHPPTSGAWPDHWNRSSCRGSLLYLEVSGDVPQRQIQHNLDHVTITDILMRCVVAQW